MSPLVVVIAVLLDVVAPLLDDLFLQVEDFLLEDTLLHVLQFADYLDHLLEDHHLEEILVLREDTQDHRSEDFHAHPLDVTHAHQLDVTRAPGLQCADFQGLQCEDPRHLIILEDLLFHVPLFVAGLLLTVAPVPLQDIVMMALLATLIVLQDAFPHVAPLPDHLFLFLE